jgi:two-component system chemotaxis response regulator CheB
MELGAIDFLAKPEARISRSIEGLREELLAKVYAVLNLEMSKVQSAMELLAKGPALQTLPREDEAPQEQGPIEVVAVASSTGGPPALQAILAALPRRFGAGIVIAQHMPAGFTRSFADRLNKLSALMVSEAESGDRILPGRVLITPGGYHLLVRREGADLTADLVPRMPEDVYVPSADRMMASVAEACGPAALAVVLTGMGRDGAEGAFAIKRQGGQCLAESEESAVVFGMPQEAIRTGAVDKVLPLGMLAGEILRRCSRNRTGLS